MLYLYPTKRRLGVEIVGAEEEHLDLYDALLEILEVADGIDEGGIARETALNGRLMDFLYLIRQAQPVPEEYLEPGTESRNPAPDREKEPPEGEFKAKVLAFPGVTLPEEMSGGETGDDEGGEIDGEEAGPDALILEDDLMVRLLWPEAVYVACALNHYLAWSENSRNADWAGEIRWRPAYGTVLRFQAQLIDSLCSALEPLQAESARDIFQSPKTSLRELCPQYLDLISDEFIRASAKEREAMLGAAIAEIARPGPRNGEVRREVETKARELGCPPEEIVFTVTLPDSVEW